MTFLGKFIENLSAKTKDMKELLQGWNGKGQLNMNKNMATLQYLTFPALQKGLQRPQKVD